MSEQIPEKMQAVVCHGPKDYRLEEVAVPERKAGRGADSCRGCRHLRQRPEVLSRRREVLGRREPTGVGGDHGDPGSRVRRDRGGTRRRRGAAVEHRGRRPGGLRADRARAGSAASASAASTTCASRTTSTASSAAPQGRWQATWSYPAEALVHKVSKDIAPAHAAFAEPLSCSLHAVERAQILFEDTVVVAGCGPIGLGMIAGARAKNPMHVIALDMAPEKLEARRALRRRHHHQHRRAGRRSDHQGTHRRLRRRRLPRRNRPPVRGSAGPQLITQARPLRRVRRLRQ